MAAVPPLLFRLATFKGLVKEVADFDPIVAWRTIEVGCSLEGLIRGFVGLLMVIPTLLGTPEWDCLLKILCWQRDDRKGEKSEFLELIRITKGKSVPASALEPVVVLLIIFQSPADRLARLSMEHATHPFRRRTLLPHV